MEFYKNGLWDYWGNEIQTGCIAGTGNNGEAFECTKLEKPENIVGIQGCLWAEELIQPEFLWNQMFPRAFAVAERASKNASWEWPRVHKLR